MQVQQHLVITGPPDGHPMPLQQVEPLNPKSYMSDAGSEQGLTKPSTLLNLESSTLNPTCQMLVLNFQIRNRTLNPELIDSSKGPSTPAFVELMINPKP